MKLEAIPFTKLQKMKNEIVSFEFADFMKRYHELSANENTVQSITTQKNDKKEPVKVEQIVLPEILCITSYPPRECGIATYSQDLIKSLNNKFSNSFSIKVCALESGDTDYSYPKEVKYILKTSLAAEYEKLAVKINNDDLIKIVLIQHEFGFYARQEQAFQQFLSLLSKPVILVFHTVLPHPDERLKLKVIQIASVCQSIIVMTNTSAEILTNDYNVPRQKVSVIAHGTHLVLHIDEKILKEKYGLKDRKVLTTFGLLSSGKGIETTINALPAIVKACPDVIFLVVGKTHPEVVKEEGEKYREMLENKVKQLGLKDHVRFVNKYLELPELLEYLQLTDIYLFTTNDPNQAVSGTFAYAMSCACPIISTPIPHAKEVLDGDIGIIFDFRNSIQLADAVILLLKNESLRKNMSVTILQKIISTAWENSAIAHVNLFHKIAGDKTSLHYNIPEINLDHLKKMTTDTGIIQFSKINQPDISTGYTLDDNSRAMIAMSMYYQSTGDKKSIIYIRKYLNFIKYCQQDGGNFLNYVDKDLKFTDQNSTVNLDDSNGRAFWALGYLMSLIGLLPAEIISEADKIIEKSLSCIAAIKSPRAIAFSIKGLYFYNSVLKSSRNQILLRTLADRLARMFNHESELKWEWFESYLTYANSIMPEAMLYAWLMTGEIMYIDIARSSLKFLLLQTYTQDGIEVISNKNWLLKDAKSEPRYLGGEQPIDVAYTVMTLSKFYDVFHDEDYFLKMETAFNWFLGKNHLHQIIYNPCTGGCYDGLEKANVNLNQGAESTVSYLMARLTMSNYKKQSNKLSRENIPNHQKVFSAQIKRTDSVDFKIPSINPLLSH